ncbi:MAG: TonB-dependent siderophore receptor, partial [Brevundimonas sp.]
MITTSSLNKVWFTTTALCGMMTLGVFPAAAQSAPEAPGKAPPAEQTTQVDDVIVTGTAVSHLADRSRTGTRMDTDPLSLPLSVSTVSEELIQRQQALTLADAASNVVGVASGNEGAFTMRGFSANIMRNGNLGADGRSNNLPIVAVSRLEVVKGPEAIIAGMTAGYGGVVNVITKTPPNVLTAEATSTLGSRGYYDVGMDVGGPLNREKTFLARLVASTQDQDENAAGYDGSSMDYLAPSATFRIPKWGTEFTAQYEYQDIRNAPALAVVTYGDRLTSDLPLLRYGAADEGQNIKSRTTT